MTNYQLLCELAGRYGISTGYTSAGGQQITTPTASLISTLSALGVSISPDPDDAELTRLLFAEYQARMSRPLPACVVTTAGHEKRFAVHVHAGAAAHLEIRLEDGGTRECYQDDNAQPDADVAGQMWGEATFHVPEDLPLGYHKITLDSEGILVSCPLIVAPARLSTVDRFLAHPASGVMAQLYSVRSSGSWGMGDFHDLGELARTLAEKAGADFLLINPLHAAEPFPPVEDSPYLPSSRRYVNPIYLRVEDIPELGNLSAEERADVAELADEFRARNRSADEIVRNEIFEAKLQVLHAMFAYPLAEERAAQFGDFKAREGQALRDFATWCAEEQMTFETGQRHALTEDLSHLTDFYAWLQFLCDEQLAVAQRQAIDAGMSIGLITDLAVGIHPAGAEAVSLADYLAPAASVGAPPDEYNQLGQDWST